MKILLSVHLDFKPYVATEWPQREEFLPSRTNKDVLFHYVESQIKDLRPGEKLCFLNFEWENSGNIVQELRQRFSRYSDRASFVSLVKGGSNPPRRDGTTSFFGEYRRSFDSQAARLFERVHRDERVEVVSFGGNAKTCYESYGGEAHQHIEQLLRARGLHNQVHSGFLPLIYHGKRVLSPFERAYRIKHKINVRGMIDEVRQRRKLMKKPRLP